MRKSMIILLTLTVMFILIGMGYFFISPLVIMTTIGKIILIGGSVLLISLWLIFYWYGEEQ